MGEFPLRTNYQEYVDRNADKLFEDNYQFKESEDLVKPLNKKIKKIKSKERQQEQKEWWKFKPQTLLSEKDKNDLIYLKLRKFLDPKNPYKSADYQKLPKYYQMGTVVEDNIYKRKKQNKNNG